MTRSALRDCCLLLLLAAVPRFAVLGHDSLWIDELFSVSWSQLDLHFLLTDGLRLETNPPVYYALLHGWMRLFGSSEFAVRAPSALASTLTVLPIYALGRRASGQAGAVLACLLFAIDPVAINASQEARAYALSAFADGASLLALVSNLPAFVLLAVMTISLHYTSIFFVAACFAAVGVSLLFQRPLPLLQVRHWVLAGLAAAVLASPLLFAAMSVSGSSNLVWIGPQTAETVLWFFLLLMAPLPTFAWSCLGAGLLLLVILIGSSARSRQMSLILWIAVLYCLFFITAGWLRPMLLPRVATWLEVPLCLLLADSAWRQRPGWRRAAACLVPFAVFLAGTATYFTFDQREDWRQAASIVTTEPACHGPLLVSEFNALGLRYYGIYPSKLAYVFLPDARRKSSIEFYLSERLMHLPELDPKAVPAFIQAHAGTALIMRDEYAHAIPSDLQAMLAQAPLHRQLAGGLIVACF